MKFFWIILLSIFLQSCGVKAPPIAPVRPEEDTRNLDCSPTEPDCDRTDPDYIPRKK